MDLPVDDDAATLSDYADVVVEAIGDLREDLVVVAESYGRHVAPIVCDPYPDGSSAVKNRILEGGHDRLGTQRHEILGWPEARADPTWALSAWSRTWSAPRRRETSGSPPGSGTPSCPGP